MIKRHEAVAATLLAVAALVWDVTPALGEKYQLKLGFEDQEVQFDFRPGQQKSLVLPMPKPAELNGLAPAPLPAPGATGAGAPPTRLQGTFAPLPPKIDFPDGFEVIEALLTIRIRDQFNPANNIPGSFGGPTALAMVMEFYGMNLTDNQVADRIGVTTAGCNGDQIARAARDFGFNSTYDTSPRTVEDLRTETAAGHPVIVNFTTPEFPGGHYAVVSGFTPEGRIVLLEPAHGVRKEMDVNEFDQAWFSPVGRALAVFVRPPG